MDIQREYYSIEPSQYNNTAVTVFVTLWQHVTNKIPIEDVSLYVVKMKFN